MVTRRSVGEGSPSVVGACSVGDSFSSSLLGAILTLAPENLMILRIWLPFVPITAPTEVLGI